MRLAPASSQPLVGFPTPPSPPPPLPWSVEAIDSSPLPCMARLSQDGERLRGGVAMQGTQSELTVCEETSGTGLFMTATTLRSLHP